MRVLLIHPPKTHQVWAGVPSVFNDKYAYLFPPLAVMTLSAWLKEHTAHEVHVIDGVVDDLDFDQLEQRIAALAPDVVGVSATASHNMVNVDLTIKAIRRVLPDVFVVMGGAHVNSFPEIAIQLPGVDACIQGDGEKPLVMLLEAIEAGSDLHDVPSIILLEDDGTIHQSEMHPPIHDLDQLPFPDREACPPGRYYTPGMRGARTTTMMSSRGCPMRCVFCNVPTRYRAHSPERVVDEMAECVHRHGTQDIHFVDDLFNVSAERVMQISELILQRDLKVWWGYKASVRHTTREMIQLAKRAGCYRMHYGVETFTDPGLKALNKKATVDEIQRIFRMTQEEGVKAIAYMIMGCPHEESEQAILDVVPFMRKLAPDYVVYSLFTPYPDAPIFDEGVKRGLWPADVWEKFMLTPTTDHDLPTAWEEHLSKEQLLELFKIVNRKFYFHPRTLLRTFAGIRTRAELKHILLGGFQLGRMELLRAGQHKI
jgi:anaerobic magnesium-protoporphyrin IX monomethyl ester cyclase